ncbi:MAG: amino acid-binding protein [Clostridia bacterium]|nr:amino acid-binding protein [Clostridia bacterium]MBQ8876490.1 amino acid-binding protein [Clostridia bacterium]
MVTKQISVFIENRKGRLGEVLDVLKSGGVNIISMSLADTAEYGLLRIISDKPQDGRAALSAAGFSSMLTDVFILKIPHEPGALQQILRVIADEELSVEYMYGLSAGGNEASIVVKMSDLAKADEVFAKHKIQTLCYSDLI